MNFATTSSLYGYLLQTKTLLVANLSYYQKGKVSAIFSLRFFLLFAVVYNNAC